MEMLAGSRPGGSQTSRGHGGVRPLGSLVSPTRWWVALLVAVGVVLASTYGATTTDVRPVAAVADPVVAAAGDIACDPLDPNFHGGAGSANACHQKAVSDLLVDAGLTAVLALGDNQYDCGGIAAFMASYNPSWGRVKDITRPTTGNHEYLTAPDGISTGCDPSNANASGYFEYFGAKAGNPGQGYYSYDIGAWHAIVLNSSCDAVGGCGPTTPQGEWLRADLAAHQNFCTLAYWHIPLYSSGGSGTATYKPFWDALYAADADLALVAHDHLYERFAPQDPNGVKDTARGLREFVVGTGGAHHEPAGPAAPNSEVRNSDTFGVLKLTLHAASYDWQFVPEAGKSFTDGGTTACHGTPNPTPPPTPSPTPPPTPSPTPPPTPVPPPPGQPGGAGCSLLITGKVRVQSPRTPVSSSLDADCRSTGTDTARWDIRHRTRGAVASFSFTRGSRSSTWTVTDATPLGTYDVVPAGAYDEDAAGTPRAVPQTRLTTSVRLLSWLTLSAQRAGKYVVLQGRATRWSQSADARRPWQHQAVHFGVRSCPTCQSHELRTRQTNDAGRFSLRVSSPRASLWSARTDDQRNTWGARLAKAVGK